MRILVAEDEAFTRLLLFKTLTQFGFSVEALEDGAAAFDMLSSKDGPSVAILDGYLPGMDGVDICRKLREIPDLPFRFLIMLTARDNPEFRIQALSQGADAYLAKPFDIKELRANLAVAERQVNFYQNCIFKEVRP